MSGTQKQRYNTRSGAGLELSGKKSVTLDKITIREAQSTRFFFKRQGWQLFGGAILVAICWAFASPVLGDGEWLGVTDTSWFWLSIALTVTHQLLVWLVFRGQLGWAVLSRIFGKADLVIWAILFLPLLVARPLSLLALSLADLDSMDLSRPLAVGLGLLLLLPTFYTFYSVAHYFGLARALGGDHFRLAYRRMPLVRKGAFRWSSNAMYAFVFLGLWSIALLTGSLAALSLALFQHAFIWAHYYCTEKPDMALMYPE